MMKKTTVYTALYILFFLASIVAALVPPSAFLFGYLSWSPELPLYVGRLHPWVSEPAEALIKCGQFEMADQLISIYGHATISSISVFLLYSMVMLWKCRECLFIISSSDINILPRIGWILILFLLFLISIHYFGVIKVESDVACNALDEGGFFSLIRPNIVEPVLLSFLVFSLVRQIVTVLVAVKRVVFVR